MSTTSLQKHLGGLLADLLAEQQKQTVLLEQIATGQLALIEALADDEDEDPDAPALTYLDGTPCR